MSVGHTVSSLQERVRFRCALPAFDANTNVTTSDILTIVQESVRELSAMMAEHSPEAYFATSTVLSTTAGVSTVSLPLSFTKLLSIHWDRDDGYPPPPIRRANVEHQWGVDTGLNWDTSFPEYRFLGNQLEFYPTPQKVHTVPIRYSTGLFPASAGDTVFLELGWDEWVVLDCCCKIRQRQEKDYGDFAAERAMKQQLIERRARRDRVGVNQTRDVRRSDLLHSRLDAEWWKL